ncbi:MAG: hypothetical protein Q9167_004653 [Letrouitia subvulpina]
MSLQRCALPLPSASSTIFRFAACASSRTSQNPQNFHSKPHSRPTARRKLVTTSTYRPHSFESVPPPPAPPRNSGIPESSIATPEATAARPPPPPPPLASREDEPTLAFPNSQHDQSLETSVPESEAQKSKPVPHQPTPPKKSKLRPRKAAMTVTPAALDHLRSLLSQPSPKLIRVGVKNRGCSGLAYHLEYVDKPGAFDEAVEQDDVKVLIDSKALFSIIGSEMDWVEDRLSRRFVFRNPNISEPVLPFLFRLYHSFSFV